MAVHNPEFVSDDGHVALYFPQNQFKFGEVKERSGLFLKRPHPMRHPRLPLFLASSVYVDDDSPYIVMAFSKVA